MMSEFLETYQEVVKREKVLRKLALLYALGSILTAIGIYLEAGFLASAICIAALLLAWFPIKKKARKILAGWLREKAT